MAITLEDYLLSLEAEEEIISFGKQRGEIRRISLRLDYENSEFCPLTLFQRLNANRQGLLYESVDISRVYGRYTLAVIDAPVLVEGKDEAFTIRALNEWGTSILGHLATTDFPSSSYVSKEDARIHGTVPRDRGAASETERLRLSNISQIIRNLLEIFHCDDRYLGLYGAFAYDFVRLFEPLPDSLPPISTQDFRLFIPDVILSYDHMREQAYLYIYEFEASARSPAEVIRARLLHRSGAGEEAQSAPRPGSTRGSLRSDTGREAFMGAVDEARDLIRRGEFFEVVLSHSYTGSYDRSPLELYRCFREINPSPYQFYVDYGDEALVGASPEMFVRVENGVVQTRPISGTVRRGADSLADYQNMMYLLNSDKEKSELDMLIDLARNDISRVCESGVKVTDYRFVEKYARVMHTVAQVEGRLLPEWNAFDAFIASLNAGTLTGAPKVAAMTHIEKSENSRRGYYGGNVGYLTFSGQLDTGIIIRTAHLVRSAQDDGSAYSVKVRVGATLLYDSDPEMEYDETEAKAAALLEAINHTV